MQLSLVLQWRILVLICIPLLMPISSSAQIDKVPGEEEEEQQVKEEYFEDLSERLIGRFYFSRKFTAFQVDDQAENRTFRYMPGSTLNMGVGATYRFLTVNLAYGWGFLNPNRDRRNSTYLDLQAHIYPRTMVIDVFGQFYKGYYLGPALSATPPGLNTYSRPDMFVSKIGASVQYLFNHEKFSFRAAFLQNEWQKKSAGSFLLGFEMHGGRAQDDVPLVPPFFLDDPERNFLATRYFEFGPNAGYAYTLIIAKYFFITAAAGTNLGFGYSRLDRPDENNTEWGVRPNVHLRTFAGYNSPRWSINANYVLNSIRLVPNDGFSNSLITGNYRLNFIYKFTLSRRSNRFFDKQIEELEKLIE
jgi:hypothetical protein